MGAAEHELVKADDTLERARNGEADALRSIYEAHAVAVTQRLWRLSGDADVARDLTQDAFVVALDRLAEFRGEGSLSAWLHGIAYNLLRDHRKASRRRASFLGRLFRRKKAEPPPKLAADNTATEDALLDRLGRALEGLDHDKRDAFVLRMVEGLSLEEASQALDAPVTTVSHRAKQAEKHIRAHFAEEEA